MARVSSALGLCFRSEGASAIVTQEVGVEEGLVNITTEVQKILDKSIAI
jgi:hypothetical protein